MKNEPVLTIGGAFILVSEAILWAAVEFGVNWTPEQIAALVAVETAVLGFIALLAARSKVTPVARAERKQREAVERSIAAMAPAAPVARPPRVRKPPADPYIGKTATTKAPPSRKPKPK